MTPPRPLKYLFAGTPAGHDWLTMQQLADHGQFTTAEAARKFVTRHPDLPRARVGRQLRVDRAAFDRYILARGRKAG